MRTMQASDAEANLAARIEAAERGEPTTIIHHGQPAAVMVAVADVERLNPANRPSLIDHLFAIPGEIEVERDQTPLRAIDL